MRKLLQEWKMLDERFIPEEQKQMYKEAFQRYKEKKGITEDRRVGKMEMQETQNLGMSSTSKGGRRTLSETIQEVGEMLVNSGRVIPLSEVFQTPPKLLR